MSFLNRLERYLGRFAISNLALYLIGGQVLLFVLSYLTPLDLQLIILVPAWVLEGEVWRLISFVFLPPVSGPLSMLGAVFLAMSWYFFHMISQALEGYWGTFRFNLYFLIGWILTVAVSFLTPQIPTGYAFFAISVFLAFALLNPDFELYLFFILPVKIKWFALVIWLGFGYSFLVGGWHTRLAILAATGNFLLFFSHEIVQRIKTGRRHMNQQVRRAALREDTSEPRHRCHKCGKTDQTHPQLDFRYSDDDKCYCPEHRPGAAKAS